MRNIGPIACLLALLTGACVPSRYSARSYRNVDTTVLYATICHEGKTIRIPADEWEEHKAHNCYRGPCRARGIPGGVRKRDPKHTLLKYDDREARAAWSEEQWLLHQEAELKLQGGYPTEDEVDQKEPR